MTVEIRRQFFRRRTQVALALMVLLPLILLAAFTIGGGENGGSGIWVREATSGSENFTLFTLYSAASFLLVVLVALFFGDTVASEASWGSLRYLLAAPVPRARLLATKATVSAGYAAFSLCLLTGVALLAGGLAYGWGTLQLPLGGDVSGTAGLLRLVGIVGYIAVSLLTTAGLAFLLSVSTDAPLGAVGGAVMVSIISSILDTITALHGLRGLLPTHYAYAWLGMLSEPIQTADMVKGMISALLYSTIFFGAAWWRFARKDVVS